MIRAKFAASGLPFVNALLIVCIILAGIKLFSGCSGRVEIKNGPTTSPTDGITYRTQVELQHSTAKLQVITLEHDGCEWVVVYDTTGDVATLQHKPACKHCRDRATNWP